MRLEAETGASIMKMSRLLQISRSGYYDWLRRPQGDRASKDRLILSKIREIHSTHPKWGLDAIWHEVLETIPAAGAVYTS